MKFYLIGGMGNALFQLNYIDYLKKNGSDVFVTDFMLKQNAVTKVLGWSIHGTFRDLAMLGIYERYKFTRGSYLDSFLLGISKKTGCSFGLYYYSEHEIPSKLPYSMSGYYHLDLPISKELVNFIRENLSALFKNDITVSKNVMQASKSAVFHFRGGDYNHLNYPRNVNYYKKLASDLDEFYVVTDDKVKAKNFFTDIAGDKFLGFLDGGSALADFYIMASAKIFVTASSTFSWWAGEVGNSEIIYEPEKFFNHISWRPQTNKNNRCRV